MARKRERAFAAFGAVLFLITSSALTIAVILSMTQQSSSNNNNSSKQTNQTKLTGTKLANFTPTSAPQTTLQEIDTQAGTGAVIKPGATIEAVYEGALMSTGVIFDAAQDHGGPQTIQLTNVIAGWSQGIPGMKVGGTRRLLIPAALGYAAQGSGSIPPNADLVFDVTVLKIN